MPIDRDPAPLIMRPNSRGSRWALAFPVAVLLIVATLLVVTHKATHHPRARAIVPVHRKKVPAAEEPLQAEVDGVPDLNAILEQSRRGARLPKKHTGATEQPHGDGEHDGSPHEPTDAPTTRMNDPPAKKSGGTVKPVPSTRAPTTPAPSKTKKPSAVSRGGDEERPAVTSKAYLSTRFTGIHTGPLPGTRRQRLVEWQRARKGDAMEPGDLSNWIAALYADVEDPDTTPPLTDAEAATLWCDYYDPEKDLQAATRDAKTHGRPHSPSSDAMACLKRDYPALASIFRKFTRWNSDLDKGKAKGNYVIVHPVGQLCNRLMAIASGFVMALVTRRGLKIDDSGFYCSMTDLFMNPGWSWLDSSVGGEGTEFTLQNPESGDWTEAEPLLCSNYSSRYHDATVKGLPRGASGGNLRLMMNQYIVPYLTTNAHYRTALEDLLRNGKSPTKTSGSSTSLNSPLDQLYYVVSKFLFRPVEEVEAQRKKFVREHFYHVDVETGKKERRKVVGVQARSGGDFTENFMNAHDWGLYRDCGLAAVEDSASASKSTAELSESDKRVLFFVATDTEKGREAAKKHLTLPSSGGTSESVIFGPGPFLLSDNPKGVQMALLDLLLLASANDRVTTSWSSYGYFAAGTSGVPANIVVDEVPETTWRAPADKEQRFMGVMHKSDRRAQCVRLPTSQPCFHKYATWGASRVSCFDPAWFEREMLHGRYC